MPVQTLLVETENAKEAFTNLAFRQLLLPEPDFATHRDSEISRLKIILTQVAQNPPDLCSTYLFRHRLYLHPT